MVKDCCTNPGQSNYENTVRFVIRAFEPIPNRNFGQSVKTLRKKFESLSQNQTSQTNCGQTFDRLSQKFGNQRVEELINRYESIDRTAQSYSDQRVEYLKQTFERMLKRGQTVWALRQKFEQMDLRARNSVPQNQAQSPQWNDGQRVRALSQIYGGMASNSMNSSHTESGLEQGLDGRKLNAFPNYRPMASTQYSQQPIETIVSNSSSRKLAASQIYGSRQLLGEEREFNVNAVSDHLDLD